MSLGGEWIRFAQGKTLVGVDENDEDFKTVEKELGEKTHKLTVSEMPSHNHKPSGYTYFLANTNGRFSFASPGTESDGIFKTTQTANTGGDQAHNNIQPSITVYFWKRVA